jgi:hypothetical protein
MIDKIFTEVKLKVNPQMSGKWERKSLFVLNIYYIITRNYFHCKHVGLLKYVHIILSDVRRISFCLLLLVAFSNSKNQKT